MGGGGYSCGCHKSGQSWLVNGKVVRMLHECSWVRVMMQLVDEVKGCVRVVRGGMCSEWEVCELMGGWVQWARLGEGA